MRKLSIKVTYDSISLLFLVSLSKKAWGLDQTILSKICYNDQEQQNGKLDEFSFIDG